jgi:predicted DNA-binding transcriptional regulator YafY
MLLQLHQRLTARELAGQLEVSERTILRDMDVLSGAGVPVVAERGAGGGWSLLGSYRTNLTGLKETEIRALFLGPSPRLLADLGLDKAADSAALKLLASAPAPSLRIAENMRQRIYLDVTGLNRAEEPVPFLNQLLDAIYQDRKVQLRYKRGDDREVERLLDPLGLVAKGNVWYLVAAVDGEVRSYRVSRVLEAEMLDQPCVRPPDFNLATYWEHAADEFIASLPRYPAKVRMHPDTFWRLQYEGRSSRVDKVGEPDAGGWLKVDLIFHGEEEACEWLLGFGPTVEVLAPIELRLKVTELAAGVVRMHSEK